mmetsp:Transcript_14014/g.21185  ORF Transcript_14014/g.21185 Transcript_14014/m.21185 type:complete len:146 (+) Transcript_14014:137-574(+)|eukprot:CAMPEP_0194775532 /NCGR_PEP_ID=MMETSP0323_2-20130528/60641_1 /TAXON_ID=2866 ORGANISM="Crypthecodinium cohnii, Strain Seligo" /NCGR_SAMPLE_ID=MMETSP0323_2 /ASSEMBLY_ACC=CAM_ASM_000346 /LENGTH=145 /DNA_ID=CAMNT_0039711557 /DNA_START=46 /DNA_END=483 /DNA_ORIENTATION=-
MAAASEERVGGCEEVQERCHDADEHPSKASSAGQSAVVPDICEAASSSSVPISKDELRTFNAFMFPHTLEASKLRDGTEPDKVEQDEDTDGKAEEEEYYLGKSLMEAKMFSDPEEREKWKNRGWRAVQCCGGALLVLALIFDELD